MRRGPGSESEGVLIADITGQGFFPACRPF